LRIVLGIIKSSEIELRSIERSKSIKIENVEDFCILSYILKMTSMTVDFSGMTQMPDTIRVKLSGGVIVEFELPSFKKAEAPRPKTMGFGPKPTGFRPKTTVFRPRKSFNSIRGECDFGILCTKKACHLTHPDLEDEKQAIFNGSPEDVHEFITELYEAFDDHHLRVFINTIKHGKFVPYQDTCDDDIK